MCCVQWEEIGSCKTVIWMIFPPFDREGYIRGHIHGDRVMFYFGIIDILQSYQLRKKIEHGIKAIIADRVSVLMKGEKFFFVISSVQHASKKSEKAVSVKKTVKYAILIAGQICCFLPTKLLGVCCMKCMCAWGNLWTIASVKEG